MPNEKKQGHEARKELSKIYRNADPELRAWLSQELGRLLLRRKFVGDRPEKGG